MNLRDLEKRIRRPLRLRQRALQGRWRRSQFGDDVVGVILRRSNGFYAIDVEDDCVRQTVTSSHQSGTDEIERAAKFLSPDSKVLVVGAHVGTIAIPLARRCGELWAIEANPQTFELLELNIAMSRLDNIHAVHLAASDRAETIEFVQNRVNSGGAKRMPKTRKSNYFYDHPKIVRVPANSLDAFFPSEEFALIFMDIEGSEYFALKGMHRLLQAAQVLVVEYLPDHLRDVAGCSSDDFVDLLAPHFSKLFIPSKRLEVVRADFKRELGIMYDRNETEAGLVFTR